MFGYANTVPDDCLMYIVFFYITSIVNVLMLSIEKKRNHKFGTGTWWLSTFNRYHSDINILKIKVMNFNHQYVKEEFPKRIVSINNTPVEDTTVFKYLGCNIKCDKPSTRDSELEMLINIIFTSLGKMINFENHTVYNRENHEYPRAY